MTDHTDTTPCKSCSMPIESGDYCQYCTDEDGRLHGFDETLERFIQFARGRDSSLDRTTAEANTLEFMARMPAWRDHPRVVGREA